jgi:hypothetical protein
LRLCRLLCGAGFGLAETVSLAAENLRAQFDKRKT